MANKQYQVPQASTPGGGGGGSSPVITSPGYFFRSSTLWRLWDPNNIDPRASGLNLLPSWKLFYLPFDITISRYRIQCDSIGGATNVFVYAAIYNRDTSLLST